MIKKIRYIGMFMGSNKYEVHEWDVLEMKNILIYNKLDTKKQIIDYLSSIKIHEESIPNFMELLKETKRIKKEEKKEEQLQKNQTRKIVEKYFK